MESPTSNLDQIPVGIYEKALPVTMSWEERLTTAAQAGYDFVEIAIDDSDMRIERLDWVASQRAGLRHAIHNTGLPVRSLSLSAHRRFPLGSPSAQTRQRALDIFKKAVDFAVGIGLELILLAGADVYHEESTDQSKAYFLEGLVKGLEWARAAGLMLALENWDIRVDSLRKAMAYVNHFNSPWFQIYADIGNLIFAGYDVLDELETARGHIAALHIKDTIPGQLRYVPLGEGNVPFIEAFTKLAEFDYQGPVVIELWTEEYPDSVEIVTAARQWLQARMEQVWQANKIKKREQIEA